LGGEGDNLCKNGMLPGNAWGYEEKPGNSYETGFLTGVTLRLFMFAYPRPDKGSLSSVNREAGVFNEDNSRNHTLKLVYPVNNFRS
jgi:hypothetical protein